MTTRRRKVLVLYSGGADSVYMLLLAKRMGLETTALMLRYGQKHEAELDYATKVLVTIPGSLAIRLEELDISGVFKLTHSNLLADGAKHVTYPNVHEMHVPARNGIFLMAALGVAETLGLDEVWIGCDYSDRLGLFPDCYQEWIVRMDQIAQINGSRPLRVKAPCMGLAKEDVLALVEAEGVKLEAVFSGYTPPKITAPAVADARKSQ